MKFRWSIPGSVRLLEAIRRLRATRNRLLVRLDSEIERGREWCALEIKQRKRAEKAESERDAANELLEWMASGHGRRWLYVEMEDQGRFTLEDAKAQMNFTKGRP